MTSDTVTDIATRWIEIAIVAKPESFGRHDPRDTYGLVPENWEHRKPTFIGDPKVTRLTDAKKLDEVCDDLALQHIAPYSGRKIVIALFRQEEPEPYLIVLLRDDANFWLRRGM